ncbi:MAG: pyridoxamine 5'-phosphate oxidase [Pseudomonadota bacterium]
MDRDGIFAGDDPVALVAAWLAEAEKTELNDPNAIALSTVDADGMPNVRIVLLKEIEPDAFVFYTNYTSVKAQELEGARAAAFVLHWKSLRRQVRVRGHISREDGPQADAYYASRGLGSRIGAHASRQSKPLNSRAELEAQVAAAQSELGETPARPTFWGGFRLRPVEIEFWADGANRLHDRFRWTRIDAKASWSVTRLNP